MKKNLRWTGQLAKEERKFFLGARDAKVLGAEEITIVGMPSRGP